MQIWGHAVYKFQESSDEATDYLKESVAFMSQISEAIRLDHVLALIWKYFIIAPKSDKGKHIMALGKKLFKALTENFPNVFFVAEDVGYINTKAIDKPLGGFSIPGVRCPAWANRIKYSQIYNYPENCLATTSLHDLDCIARWWANLDKSDRKKYTQQVRKYKKSKGAPFSKTSLTDVIEIIFASRANIASITLRDLVGDLRRYNTPGTQNLKNWRARSPQDIEDINFGPIEEIIRKTNRFL
jgi:4-alpha-glucanotransferase